MMKNFLFAVALLSLALAVGCAQGGNGVVPTVTVKAPQDIDPSALYPGQPNLMFTATTTDPANAPVTWSVSGTGCTGTPNPCGTIDSATGVFQAGVPGSATITATLVSDSMVMGSLPITVIPVSVVVTPYAAPAVNVGQNLMQEFTAVAVPDSAPQTFNWTCTPTGSCGHIVCTPSSACEGQVPGVATYTAPLSNGSVTIAATSTVSQPNPGVGTSKVAVVSSRLPQGPYTFRFAGYDGTGNSVAVAGSVNVGASGMIASGVEDVVIGGAYHQYTTVSGSYAPTSNNNNLGTLTLDATAGGGPKYIYTAVLTSAGVVRMIESSVDTSGITGSGVMQKSAPQQFDAGAQTFVFGFTGVDSTGQRVGYVGLLPMDGQGNIGLAPATPAGMLDANDNGNANSVCGTPPCSVTGTYVPGANGLWQMILNSGATSFKFDFFVAGGVTETKTAMNPLTLYAISTDSVDAMHPALSGNMVYQVPMTYNNAAFSGSSVSSLTGVEVMNSSEVPNSSNVALIVGTTDGTSSGTGGTGGFTGTFDQNDNGTITSVGPSTPFAYTYVATPSINGRYTFQMLGNTNPVVAPLPFVLYASGANRGFLLDQSSKAVMTGSMNPQLSPNGFNYTPSEMPGTYAAATIVNSDSGITPVVENLLLTSTGNATYNVAGTQYTQSGGAGQSLKGSYTLNNNASGGGTGTITLTTPAAQTYVIYVIDATGIPTSTNAVIDDFMMIGTTSGTPSSISFAQQ